MQEEKITMSMNGVDVATGKPIEKKYFTGENPASLEYNRGFITKFVDWDYRSGQPEKVVRVQIWLKDSECGSHNLEFDTFNMEYFGEYTSLEDIKNKLNTDFDNFGYSKMTDKRYLKRCMNAINHEFPFFNLGKIVDTYNTDDLNYS